MYKFLRRILFLFSPETAHSISMGLLKMACSVSFVKRLLSNYFAAPQKRINLLGLNFKNPIGLGAGFDKNAQYLRELEVLGFGFVEIGTVTPRPQPGNDKPRVFRLPADKALINRMGFNNDGAEVIAERLKQWRKAETSSQKITPFIIGGNIGKNKITPNEDAWRDYEICFNALQPYVDFFVVNVSSPNTPGLRELQEKDALKKILMHLQSLNRNFPVAKPILLKIAPDLSWSQLDDVIDLANEIKLDGLVATNTTISRDNLSAAVDHIQSIGAGGLSGKPLEQRSTEVLAYITEKTKGAIPVIGSGGIFTAADAQKKMKAGASLMEVWTGFIYEGPVIVKKICKSL
ncbi:MAG TPA: quinone-dependent dihydroorotate dehydrogenase [Flavisolibacter sp.]|nr:quinone-dependent dihydroorotate dehydrogenase [Flavisolibacter sp.]